MATSVLRRIVLFMLAVAAIPGRGIWASGAELESKELDSSEICSFGHIPCDNKDCILRGGWCDGNFDCSDGSDESYCLQKSPSDKDENINNCDKSLHFQCDTGECIPISARCDDLPDCTEKEDEENCDYYFERDEYEGEKLIPAIPSMATTTEVIPTKALIPEPRTYPTLTLHSVPTNEDSLNKALIYILSHRDKYWGWRNSTAKVITAIHLADRDYFNADNIDGQMSKKQLQVQLAIDLMRKDEVPMRLPELSHYVHALLVTCENPRDFHGVNLLKVLKKQMNHRRHKKQFVSPLVYLALCNSGEVSDNHIRRLKNMAYRRTQELRWLDIQAYALLAISCYSRTNQSSDEWRLLKKDVAKNLTDWQQPDGSFGSIYSTALVLQALIAAEEHGTESVKGRAMVFLKLKQNKEGSFGGDLDNFYVLPALNLKSLATVGDHQCKEAPAATLNTEPGNWGGLSKKKTKRKKGKLNIHYSLWIGGEKNEIHTITLSLAPHSSFMDVMKAAESANPKYKHEILTSNRGPFVQSIAGRSVDFENNLYWTLYRKVPLPFRPILSNATATSRRLRLLGATKYIKDIRKLYPKNGEHLAFWLQSYF